MVVAIEEIAQKIKHLHASWKKAKHRARKIVRALNELASRSLCLRICQLSRLISNL